MNFVVRASLRRTLTKSCNVGGNAKIEFEKKIQGNERVSDSISIRFFEREDKSTQKNRNLEAHFLDTLSKKVFTHLSNKNRWDISLKTERANMYYDLDS